MSAARVPNLSGGRPADTTRTVRGRNSDVSMQIERETETGQTTSSRIDELGAQPTNLTARIRDLDPLDATAATICTLRPNWAPVEVRQVLARDRRPWATVVAAALAAALNPDVRLPAKIETYTLGDLVPTPTPMRFEQWRDADRCPNGSIHDPHPCAMCRAGITEETT